MKLTFFFSRDTSRCYLWNKVYNWRMFQNPMSEVLSTSSPLRIRWASMFELGTHSRDSSTFMTDSTSRDALSRETEASRPVSPFWMDNVGSTNRLKYARPMGYHKIWWPIWELYLKETCTLKCTESCKCPEMKELWMLQTYIRDLHVCFSYFTYPRFRRISSKSLDKLSLFILKPFSFLITY